MALYTRSKPVGIDISIAGFQKFLYSQVKAAWNISDDLKYDCYDRAYRDYIDTGYVPRALVPNNLGTLEYTTLTFNPDLNWAMSFFSVGDSVKEVVNRTSRSQIALIFAVNLDAVKSGITDHRADEEVRNDIERICYIPRFNMDLTGVETGYENVFRDYKGLITQDQKNLRDFNPLHVFKINFELNYDFLDTLNCQ